MLNIVKIGFGRIPKNKTCQRNFSWQVSFFFVSAYALTVLAIKGNFHYHKYIYLSWFTIKGNFHYHKYIYLSWFMKKNQLIFVSKLIYAQKLADLYFCECYYQIKK